MAIFAKVLAFLGIGAANAGSQACLGLMWDEENTPKSLIK